MVGSGASELFRRAVGSLLIQSRCRPALFCIRVKQFARQDQALILSALLFFLLHQYRCISHTSHVRYSTLIDTIGPSFVLCHCTARIN